MKRSMFTNPEAFALRKLAGKLLMSCMDAPDPPDLSGQAAASEEIGRLQQETAREQLAWAREQDRMNRETLSSVLDVQLPAMRDQFENAREDRQRYEDVYRPQEDALIAEAKGYDTPERRAEERGRALTDVAAGFDAARRNSLQRLESYGIDPSMTRNGALDLNARIEQAKAGAGAANAADQRVENTGRALRADVVNLGKGLPSQVASSYNQSVAAGQSGVGGANATTNTSTSAMGLSNQTMGGALAGFGQSAGIQTQGFNNQMNQFGANQNSLSGVGGILGLGASFLADGGMPTDEEGPVDEGPTDGSGIDDQVPAMLSVGEYVIPADVVATKGREFFDKLVEKYHTPAAKQEQPRRALPMGA